MCGNNHGKNVKQLFVNDGLVHFNAIRINVHKIEEPFDIQIFSFYLVLEFYIEYES